MNREDITRGAEDLGVDFDEQIQFLIDAMTQVAGQLGLTNSPSLGSSKY